MNISNNGESITFERIKLYIFARYKKQEQMEQANSNSFLQNAMKYGTYLGIFWAVMYVFLFKYLNHPLLSMLCPALFFGSPVVAALLAINYRKKECGNFMTYSQAWSFLFFMYICATILSTLTNYLYFKYLDNGSFITNYSDMISQVMNTPGLDKGMATQINNLFEPTMNMLSQMGIKEMVLMWLNNNILSSLMLPAILALFVRKQK